MKLLHIVLHSKFERSTMGLHTHAHKASVSAL